MQSAEIREKFLRFFEKRGHAVISSASLVPENDPSVLFNTAGMQPLTSYLLGEVHPKGKRLVNIQKCVRTQDIDEVGDKTHDTFFEMLGNWSLGDYFKEESIKWSFELLTDKEEGMGLDPKHLYVTVFGGNDDAPRDDESFEIWKKYMPENRIYFLTWNGKKEPNWWDAGDNGPAGPDTEIFYDLTGELGDMTKDEYLAADDRQEVVEIWNNVFMEYVKKDGKVVGKLQHKNVDTGAGLERWATVLQRKDNIFDTDLFSSFMLPEITDLRSRRIVADHIRTSVFMLGDGVEPSNKERGYVLRRLLRRAWAIEYQYKLSPQIFEELIIKVIDKYKTHYPNLEERKKEIINSYFTEWQKFKEILDKAGRELGKREDKKLSGKEAFDLFASQGVSLEVVKALGYVVDETEFAKEMQSHKEVSKAGMEQKFKGGLAGHSEMEVKYHTATHLLHQALHDVLGDGVDQRGSNITTERLRFDFSFPRKLSEEEKGRVEEIVNQKIEDKLPMNKVVMKKEEAEQTGARHFFGEKYPDEVSVYYIGETLESAYSKEFCGGPHVENVGGLGKFKITKEEAVSAGVRRIKAVLQ